MSLAGLGKESLAELTILYLATLNDREIQAYHIAVDHLGMSFTMERSNGFRQWKKQRDEKIRIVILEYEENVKTTN
jgi:hypothetical protein